jgi:prepilin-type N-terminal cleavage/methylation domain-containing protein
MIFKKLKRGFTLAELMAVIAIIAVISVLALLSFNTFGNEQALDKNTLSVLSALNSARSSAISGLADSSGNLSDYGVHLESGRATSFTGDYFNVNDPSNSIFDLNNNVSMSWTLGSGDSIIFKRVTGETLSGTSGTINLNLTNGSNYSSSITVFPTGAIQRN